MKTLTGYKTRAYGWAAVPCFDMLTLPLDGARFLTFMQVFIEDLPKYARAMADDITRPSALWLMLKDKNLVV